MIKKSFVFFLVLFLTIEATVNAQSFYRRSRKTGFVASFGLGTAAYQGDLRNPAFTFDLSGVAYGAVEFPVQGRFSVRGNLMWYRISSDDKNVDSRDQSLSRNLSFKSSNYELSVMGIIQITPTAQRSRTDFTTYALIGLGGTYYNPKAELNGTDYKLRPLQTEGIDYGDIALVIPVGVGASYRINYQLSLGVEAAYRWTTTDYLDDVSTAYLGENAFPSGSIAQQLADRRPEVGQDSWPAGHQRGDADDNDGYWIVSAKLNYHFNQGLYYKRKRNRRATIFRRR